MNGDTFLYFAYGSNMLTARLCAATRCPSAVPVGVAELSGYELKCHKVSKDGSGKFDIVRSDDPQARVAGVVFLLPASERASLNRAEGFGDGYEDIELQVQCGTERLEARAYFATKTDPALKPFSWYRALAVAGAREHGLSDDYIAKMESIPASEDPNRKRHDENMALAGWVFT